MSDNVHIYVSQSSSLKIYRGTIEAAQLIFSAFKNIFDQYLCVFTPPLYDSHTRNSLCLKCSNRPNKISM